MIILLTVLTTCMHLFYPYSSFCSSVWLHLNMDINCVKTIRYLLNPKMEVTRCFGVEYNAEELSEVIGKELNRNPS